MKLYHGTTSKNADKILLEGKIQVTNSENTNYGVGQSTHGYVYMSKCFNDAFGRAVVAGLKFRPICVTVFEIHVDEKEVMKDPDEELQETIACSLPCAKNSCMVIERDLIIPCDVIRYYRSKEYKDVNEAWDDTDDINFYETIKDKWINL